MSEKCMSIAYVDILVFISLCISVSVSVCRSYVVGVFTVLRAHQMQYILPKTDAGRNIGW